MTPDQLVSLLALLADLRSQVGNLAAENADLRAALDRRDEPHPPAQQDGRTPPVPMPGVD